MRNDIFAAMVAQRLNIALPSHKVATPASFVAMHDLWLIYNSFHRLAKKSWPHPLTSPPNSLLIVAQNEMVWNFGNDCRKVRVAVAKHDLHEQFLSRNRAMSRFYRDWIAIARQYCPCIGSSNQMIVMLLFRIALNLCTNMAAKLSKYCGCIVDLFLITFVQMHVEGSSRDQN